MSFFGLGASRGGGWGGAYRPWGCCGGWYGGGYRRPLVINSGNINIGNNVDFGNRTNIGNRIGDGNSNLNLDRSRTNLYNRMENRSRNAAPTLARQNLKAARRAVERANDVFTDRNGNVARRVGDEWQTRDAGQWKTNQSPSQRTTPNTRQQVGSQSRDRMQNKSFSRDFDRPSLDRSYPSRQRGFSRERTSARAPAFRGRR